MIKPPLVAQFRAAMRGVGSSVSVITCKAGGELAGMTVSSVSSVSINPEPMISFNIQVPSRTSTILDKSRRFAVNVLAPSPEMKQLALAFAGARGHDYNPFEELAGAFESHEGVPIVKGSNTFICSLSQQVRVQDHLVLIARVHGVLAGAGSSMAYYGSKFHAKGTEIA